MAQKTQEVGFVTSVNNFLIHLNGLPSVRINDLIESDNGIRAWVNALLPDSVEALVLDEGKSQPGQLFRSTGQKITTPSGQFLLGRAINPLGVPIDGKILPKESSKTSADFDRSAPGIKFRQTINEQLQTGIILVDSLIPIGKGQRELVIGDPRSGKIDFLIDVIINQKNTGVICIYASIGKPIAEVRSLIDTLRTNQALPYTIIVAASSSDPAPLIFLTPQTAFALAEYFQTQGKDILVILDDLGIHAKIYREIALLGDRAPGRESYPGDIFYQHAHLLERAGNFNPMAGGGSITALPVIDTNLNDFTGFIPTNIMAMTDGHLLFRSALFNQGQRPAIDLSLSVSRVGQQTQNRVQNSLATRVKQILAEAAQLETVSSFSFELPYATRLTLNQRDAIEEMIKQPPLTRLPRELQIILLALPLTNLFQDKDKSFARLNHGRIIELLSTEPELINLVREATQLSSEDQLLSVLQQYTPYIASLLQPTATTRANSSHMKMSNTSATIQKVT